MLKNHTINLSVVERVARTLGSLTDEVIFVGGAVVALYVTDSGAEQPRPTADIDISVQVSSYVEMENLRERLAQRGIFPASGERVLYRYTLDDIKIDFIPYEETALGPTNSWLKPGFEERESRTVGEVALWILPVRLFLATKWEAYKNRGSDPRWSPDFEDLIYVIDNNVEVVEDIEKGSKNLREFLAEMSAFILAHDYRNEIIESHIFWEFAVERRKLVVRKLERIVELGKA